MTYSREKKNEIGEEIAMMCVEHRIKKLAKVIQIND